uniref:Uncharacterized protein n=1 Tax=Oryza sativa subsp. japonica TaxID=39947 RepID=Q60ET8_ORYSJ|nr:hypothetical protein [Oryza sativa Japonica Group]
MTAPIPDLLLLPRLHCNLFVGLFFLYINMPNTGTGAIGGSIGNDSGIAGRDGTENDNTNGDNTIALSSTGAFSKLKIPIYDHIFNTVLIYNSSACAGRLRAAACLPRPPHRCPVRPREIKGMSIAPAVTVDVMRPSAVNVFRCHRYDVWATAVRRNPTYGLTGIWSRTSYCGGMNNRRSELGGSAMQSVPRTWSHQRSDSTINDVAITQAVIGKLVTGVGYLSLTWSTVVLLGGFVSTVPINEFWFLTAISLVLASTQNKYFLRFTMKNKARLSTNHRTQQVIPTGSQVGQSPLVPRDSREPILNCHGTTSKTIHPQPTIKAYFCLIKP